MKKFIAIALVLAIAPFASAGLITLEGNGTTITAVPGQVTINIVTTESVLAFEGLVSGAPIVSALNGATADVNMSMAPVLGDTTVQFVEANFNGMTGTIASFVVNYTGGEMVINLAGTSLQGGSMDTMGTPLDVAGSVTIVPEPMTMALLGLGGLFIRRRRA